MDVLDLAWGRVNREKLPRTPGENGPGREEQWPGAKWL